MPQLHLAMLIAAIQQNGGTWSITLQHDQDPHWKKVGEVFTYELTPAEFQHYVEVRLPAQAVYQGRTFRVSAKATTRGGREEPWAESGGFLVSPPLAAVSKFFLDVEALPIGGLPEVVARGGGHFHVKDAGGDG